jgi:hypothetical protein
MATAPAAAHRHKNHNDTTMRRILAILFAALLCTTALAAPDDEFYPLPSGKLIPVLSAGRVNYGEDKVALMLRYQTALSLDDKAALDAEVDEIWNSFRADVDKTGLSLAIVSANEKPTGFFVKSSRAKAFVFKKGADGAWSKVPGVESH